MDFLKKFIVEFYGSISMAKFLWLTRPAVSATCTIKSKIPATVGVPEMVPVAAPRLNPLGSAGELVGIDQV